VPAILSPLQSRVVDLAVGTFLALDAVGPDLVQDLAYLLTLPSIRSRLMTFLPDLGKPSVNGLGSHVLEVRL